MGKKVELYVVHSDRSVKKHSAKVNLPDYLDTKTGRWIFRPGNIFDAKPLAEFETWADFLGWKPLVGPPVKPAALAIDGDIVPQAPVPMSDEDLSEVLVRTPVAAAQDLMTDVGTTDGKQSALTWALAGVIGACGLAIMIIAIIAAIAFLGSEDDTPAVAQTPPSMSAPSAPAPVGTPWPWPTPVPQPTAVPVTQPRRRRQARLGLAYRLMRRSVRRKLRASRTTAKQAPKPAGAASQFKPALKIALRLPTQLRGEREAWSRLLVYDTAFPRHPYMVGLPRRELRRHFNDKHELTGPGQSSMWACKRTERVVRNGYLVRRQDTIEPIAIERDQRADVTPEFTGQVRQWNRKHANKQKAKLLVYDDALAEQPYMVTLPRQELRSRFEGGTHEMQVGRSSMWACRRSGSAIEPIPIERDQRTTRTPKFVFEFMKLRSDKSILDRPRGKAEKMLMMGAAGGIVVTCVAGLILTVALTG